MASPIHGPRRQTMDSKQPFNVNDQGFQNYDSLVVPPSKAGKLPSVSAVTAASMPAVCISILLVELCERLCFYTFTGTQEFFLERLGYSLAEAGGMNAAMGTLCMAWALFAGWIADVQLGRYQTIFCFGLVYAVGAVLAAAAAWPGKESSSLYMLGIMVLVPLGTAGLKANISNFGADQYDTNDPAQAIAQEKFFSWFYMSINCGSAVAYGYLTTLGSSGGMGIPKRFGYFSVFLIAAVFMFVAVVLFRSKKAEYRMQPIRQTSPMGAVAKRLIEVARRGSLEAKSVCAGLILLTLGVLFSVAQAVAPEASFAGLVTKLAFACSAAGICMVIVPCRKPTWLDDDAQFPGRDLLPARDTDFSDEEIQAFLRLLPLLFTANLAFSALYNSMQFWYQQQACQMDLRVGGTQLAGSFFCIADCLGIVLATPIAVDWLNPIVEKKTRGQFGHGAKFGLGMLFAAFSVFIAARFEAQRRLRPVLPEASNCAPEGIHMSDMSATWMVIPFFLMGLGEIYTQPVLMHLAYTQSPVSMRTLTAATGLVVGAVSNAIFTVQIAALAPFVPNDLNKGNLEYGYFANIAIGFVFYGFYLIALRYFEEQVPDSV